MKKIIHLCHEEKFLPAFIELVRSNFPNEQHHFVVMKQGNGFDIGEFSNVTYVEEREQKLSNRLFLIIKLIKIINNFDKVIFHSLFKVQYIQLLFLLKKESLEKIWVVWGGDLYQQIDKSSNSINNKVFSIAVSNLNGCITQIGGDKLLVEKTFNCKLKHYSSFFYPSNVVKKTDIKSKAYCDKLTILLGNSACKNNNHLEMIEKISFIKNREVEVICPLSYGDTTYAQSVINAGKAAFGDKFHPLTTFLSKVEYEEVLAKVDVAIFAHDRQQAFGNIIVLLEMGKKVYLKNKTTHYKTLKSIGFNIYSIEDMEISKLSDEEAKENKDKAVRNFSITNLNSQLEEIFNG
ncbi:MULTISPECIES: TDP-N-acetylfucosamine:lipid II N-acetylfucosaminyltransferase [Vibrio]|uniref:TDP-N-acetylfucosamine:lipid II N-acetylfucosaminyltransferase n=1 Tax=Vibrio TaxID=662 RepID=UPI00211A5C57|nr:MULTISPECIES: TDP-N-acetylfucosamine:lipid II N-acetylfucosaminyltransferase [Vibrio]MCQ9070337.1 TDP-N-acetylfucosamine:lipid II N-acetylfucosaminyltransferase [Vibrio alginolyticus]MDW1974236.1 TDP-N-acetylfucosamine:lipid II N-acetylfucosaminyltransferase [Vibrio sp. Vb1980]